MLPLSLPFRRRLLVSAISCAALWSPGLAAQTDPVEPALEVASVELETVTVIGSKEAQQDLVGSGVYLDREDLTRQGYDDINRLLREVSGVYIREEDGYGLFPNISLRGVDPGRSAKLTLMEDGVLTAPAPYSDPAAYYSPTAGRMSGLEVLKGSSQVRFGPHSTGGVINYLSTPIPDQRAGLARLAYGSENEIRAQQWFGETLTAGSGRFGYLVEVYHRQTDGFKEIDGPQSAVGPDAQNSGFERTEPMVKLSWEPAGDLYQRFELKYGLSDMDANETYLGLSEADFDANPYRRYAGSRFDQIVTEHERSYLRHFIRFNPATELTTTAYYNQFERNWFKIFGVNDGVDNVSLSQALANTDSQAFAILRGEGAGSLRYRNNNRYYGLKGLETLLDRRFATGSVEHELRVGLRLHEDYAGRFQNDETFVQDAEGVIVSSSAGIPGSQDNRRSDTRALAFHLEDSIKLGALTLQPGVRVESLEWDYEDRRSDTRRSGDDTLTAGGLGFNWQARSAFSLFGGVYQGFSPPSPSGATQTGSDQEQPEESLSAELGLRYSGKGLNSELAVFATRFDNLIVSGNLGASGTDDGGSVGEVDVHGVEYALQGDLSKARGWSVKLPMRVALTYTRAEIGNDSTSAGTGGEVESIFSGGEEGAELPYIPNWQATYAVGAARGIWSLDLQFSYVGESWATALNTDEQIVLDEDGTAVADARGGKIDDFLTVDLTGKLAVHPRVSLFANVYNLLDEEYLVSRLPDGPRPGAPLTALVGAEIRLF